MSDPLSDAFRANVQRIQEERGLSDWQLGKVIGGDPSRVRTQLRRGYGFTLATVHRYARALEVPVAELLDDHGTTRIDERAG